MKFNIIEIKKETNLKKFFNITSFLSMGKDKIYLIVLDDKIKIERSYSDFHWLYDILIDKFPYIIIRNIKIKENFETYENIFIELLKDIYKYKNMSETEYFIKFMSENINEFYNFKNEKFISNKLNFLEKNYTKLTMNSVDYLNDSVLLNLKDPKINKIFIETKNYKEFLPKFIVLVNEMVIIDNERWNIIDNLKENSMFFTDLIVNSDENTDKKFYNLNEINFIKFEIDKLYYCLNRRNNLFFEYAQIDNYLNLAYENLNNEKRILLEQSLIDIKEKIKIFNENFNKDLIKYYNDIQKNLKKEFEIFKDIIKIN